MSEEKIRVLVMIDWYLPGFKAGGPIRSVANLVEALGEHCHFSIVTTDKDYGEKKPYPDIEPNTWIERSPDCRVWYCAADAKGYRHFRSIIKETDYDVLYLNSMFSLRYTIFPLWNARSQKPETPVVLAPRGMLHQGALSLKRRKKMFFLRLIKLIGAHKAIRFQATDAQEIQDIRQVFGEDAQVVEAPNLPRLRLPEFKAPAKVPGDLRLIFLSRISIKKGVHYLLERLKTQSATIQLDLYGPDKEPGYWARCEAIITELPANITVRKLDPVEPDRIPKLMQEYHAFAMPTAGENFGHAIFEALAAGRPVLLSDQHPWTDLEVSKAGYAVPLDAPEHFAKAIAELAEMDEAELGKWAMGARNYAEKFLREGDLVERTLGLFRDFPEVEEG
jgi:glycosyltransferase involved in cell wall biosynthesis